MDRASDSTERWRLMIFDRPSGPWRDTRQAAQQDAIEAGYGEMDEQYGGFFITVPAWLQWQGRR